MPDTSETFHHSTQGLRVVTEHLSQWAQTEPDRKALTFIDYLSDRAGAQEHLTYGELQLRVTAAAARLQQHLSRGDRLAILAPQSVDYIVHFLAALRAGIIAVPLFSPDLPGHSDRLSGIINDCDPAAVLASSSNLQVVSDFLETTACPVKVVVMDDNTASAESAPTFSPVEVNPSDLAYLQYTSGSTRLPAGVLISHANLVVSASQAIKAVGGLDPDEQATAVSWLPLFHDMGLVSIAGTSIVCGAHAVVMDPIAFVLKPLRWLTALSNYPNTMSPAPNFAYDLCASKITDADKAGLRLDGVRALFNGAEPVRPETLANFESAFGPCGLPSSAMRPCYGLAEATLYVASPESGSIASETVFDFEQLSTGSAVAASEETANSVRMVSVGHPVDQLVAIADPETGRHLPDGQIGEIWIHGPNVSSGYWNKPELTAELFGQTLTNPRDALPSGPWLRSGDLGVVYDGAIYITGRMKDLIIIGGRNHYPQDLEATVEGAHTVIGRHRSAAFSVDTEAGEGVVVVAEISRHATDGSWDPVNVSRDVRKSLSQRHSIAALDVVLVVPNEVPRTSSGKIARAATKQRYLEGTLARAGSPA